VIEENKMVNPNPEQLIYTRPAIFTETPNTFCPGCTHGIGIRLVAEVLEEMKVTDHTIGVASVGCSVFAYNFFDFDFVQAPHGRAPAMATGVKRSWPDRIVFTYQGDGDLASIGMGEIVHACARGEKVTVIFVNNANYGMTGGQLAPTTLIDMYTSSTTGGRKTEQAGFPIRVCEMLATLDGPSYITRVSVHSPANVRKAKKAISLAFKAQVAGLGLALVEVISPCPINWKVEPAKAGEWVVKNMLPQYPLGEYKVTPEIELLRKGDKE
jgi:2-oxoglutarate ferredoxin oxidoreductase subunit beta